MPSHSRSGGDFNSRSGSARCSAGTASRIRTWKKKRCPMSLPHAAWVGCAGGRAGACVCGHLGRAHAIPARQGSQACLADFSAGSRPNGWAAWVPLVIAIAEQICNQAKPIVPFQSGGIERRQKIWPFPPWLLVRPQSARAPGVIPVALSRAPAPQLAQPGPPALPRAAPLLQLHRRRPGMGGDLKRARLLSHTTSRAAMVTRFVGLCRPDMYTRRLGT